MEENLIIENVSKSFGNVKILKNINLKIKKGEFFSLLGPSGCGKTTLLRIIAGFEDPDDKENSKIILNDTNLIPLQPNKRKVNTVFQSYALFPHLTVFENTAFSLRLKKLPEKEIKEEVLKYLKLVKMEDHINKKPSQLSGGQKQRVAIARALINKPDVLLLDEPLSALDAKLRQHLLIELDTIHDDVGITFIYVTHDQQEALSVSDRIAIMDKGEIVQIGTPAEIYESPKNTFVADFIGDTNFIQGKIEKIVDNYGYINFNNNLLKFDLDIPANVGNEIKFTIRPEKIRITKDKPNNDNNNFNVIKGIVDEVIYTGFLSKYFVKTDNDYIYKVVKQHVQFYTEETPIKWKDEVYIWWNADDSYLVEVL